MKMMKNLQSASLRVTPSLSSNPLKTKKPTIRLNVGRAENALRERARTKPSERVRRAPLERMGKIHRIIAEGNYPNARQLARELEIGYKTILRDIEYMRDHYSQPIAYDCTRGGYYYSQPVHDFAGFTTMTETEMSAIMVAHKAVAQYQDTPFHRPLKVACEKLTRHLDSKDRSLLEHSTEAVSFRPLAPEDTDVALFKTCTAALRAGEVLKFCYRKPGGKTRHTRLVHPYHVTCSDNRWYLLGYDEERHDIRTFALARMSSMQTTDKRFTPPDDFDPAKYLSDSFTVMSGTGDYEVVIDFDAWATDQLRGRKWHATQTVTELADGASRMTMHLSALEEVERWILSWGTHATVIGPAALTERISTTISHLSSRYPNKTAITKPEA
ncbi:MAG: helix-turn-helix, type 11 domain protein [Verrucomicrobiales bacterium]|nr:helix-turn-helix, type 11 domain protein [Verrucomicrobiales bacterium]